MIFTVVIDSIEKKKKLNITHLYAVVLTDFDPKKFLAHHLFIFLNVQFRQKPPRLKKVK